MTPGIQVHGDGRTRHGGYLLEEVTIAMGARNVPWDYTPVGPFKVQRYHQSGAPDLSSFLMSPTLDVAVAKFGEHCMPTLLGFAAEIVDETFRTVFGWSRLSEVADALMYATGVGAAFEMAERLGIADPIELGIWEVQARRTAPGG